MFKRKLIISKTHIVSDGDFLSLSLTIVISLYNGPIKTQYISLNQSQGSGSLCNPISLLVRQRSSRTDKKEN